MGGHQDQHASHPSATHSEEATAVYIVTIVSEPPVISYTGGVDGIPATDPSLLPATGGRKRLDASAPNVIAYQKHLEASHDAVLRSLVPPVRPAEVKLYSYTVTNNGFAARLSASQASQLRSNPAVGTVQRSGTVTLAGGT